jgi:hypothetical protein
MSSTVAPNAEPTYVAVSYIVKSAENVVKLLATMDWQPVGMVLKPIKASRNSYEKDSGIGAHEALIASFV